MGERREGSESAEGADEIEITPEMLRAGLIELYEFNRLEDDGELAVAGIFRTMYELMPTCPSASCLHHRNEAIEGSK